MLVAFAIAAAMTGCGNDDEPGGKRTQSMAISLLTLGCRVDCFGLTEMSELIRHTISVIICLGRSLVQDNLYR